MTHLGDETIALAALGEPVVGAASAHLEQCSLCQLELESFDRIVTLARLPTDVPAELVEPPPGLWERIAVELGIDPLARTGSSAPVLPAPTRLVRPGRARFSWWSGRPMLIAASVAALIVGAAGALVWTDLLGDDEGAVLATVTLEPLPDHAGDGHADVVETPYGRELHMTLDAAAPADSYLQVWLLSADATRMVPLGVIAEDIGRWALPDGVSFSDYPLVDVSIEPYDGNPSHSKDSLVRGRFDTATSAAALP